MKNKSGGSPVTIIVCIIIILIAFGYCASISDQSGEPSRKPSSARRTVSPELEAAIQQMISDGQIHSVDVASHRVRIDPLIWLQLSLDTKQSTVVLFSKYFDQKNGYKRVDILSNRNDKKLATYSVWDGIKILE